MWLTEALRVCSLKGATFVSFWYTLEAETHTTIGKPGTISYEDEIFANKKAGEFTKE